VYSCSIRWYIHSTAQARWTIHLQGEWWNVCVDRGNLICEWMLGLAKFIDEILRSVSILNYINTMFFTHAWSKFEAGTIVELLQPLGLLTWALVRDRQVILGSVGHNPHNLLVILPRSNECGISLDMSNNGKSNIREHNNKNKNWNIGPPAYGVLGGVLGRLWLGSVGGRRLAPWVGIGLKASGACFWMRGANSWQSNVTACCLMSLNSCKLELVARVCPRSFLSLR